MAYNSPVTDNGETGRRTGRRGLWIIAGIAAVGATLAVIGIWHLPARMYPATDQSEARAALQGGLLTAAAALLAVAGGLIALDETRQANAEIRRANENTHVRELYVTAIGLLSSPTVDGRWSTRRDLRARKGRYRQPCRPADRRRRLVRLRP